MLIFALKKQMAVNLRMYQDVPASLLVASLAG